jgi:hypothetical protein
VSALRTSLAAARGSWNSFADRFHLRALPALPTIVIALAVAIVLPLEARVDDRPTELAPTLAAERLARYARTAPAQGIELGPTGAILAVRPAYYWPAHPGAVRYRFRLDRADGTPWLTPTEVETNYFLHDPAGGVQPGTSYTFTVDALDAERRVVRSWRASFSVRNQPPELENLRRRAARELSPFERDLVLLGYYAESVGAGGSHHDVTSAFLAAWEAGGPDFRARMLALPHDKAFETWLDRQLERFAPATPD